MKILVQACALMLLPSVAICGSPLPQNPATQPREKADSAMAGVWRGDSICATDAPSCHNEKVVYYIKTVPDNRAVMFIRADKIVQGKAITMGAGEWEYDRAGRALTMRLWRLKFEGNQMEGTLTLSDKTVFRRMTLRKDE